MPRTREKGHNLPVSATHGRVNEQASHNIRVKRDFRETCSARTVLPPIRSTAAFDELP